MNTDTSLSSINFSNLDGGNFGLNQETGDKLLGFSSYMAFGQQLILVLCCISCGIYYGSSVEKNSQMYTEETTGKIHIKECTQKKTVETSGDKNNSTSELVISYDCKEEIEYKVDDIYYAIDRTFNYPTDKSQSNSNDTIKVYYNPDSPKKYNLSVVEKGSGNNIIFTTICCGICCLVFLYFCFKDVGCRGFYTMLFIKDQLTSRDSTSDKINAAGDIADLLL